MSRKTSNAGFEPAALEMARLMDRGAGTPADEAGAVRIYLELGEKGVLEAGDILAGKILTCPGEAEFPDDCIKWLTSAAGEQNSLAMAVLGIWL